MTPCATARMVAVASFVNSAPRAAPATRSKMARLARLPDPTEGHDDAGDDECGEELQKPDANAGNEAERHLREVADLRLQACDQSRQVGVRRRPDRIELLADHGPRRDSLARGRDLERALLHVDDQLMHRVAQRTHQHGGRHDDQGDAEEDQDRRGQSLLSSHLVREVLVQRIERDGQNQRPDHQRQEGREDLVAKHGQGQDEPGTDEHVQQPGGVASPQFAIKLVVRAHMRLPPQISAPGRGTRRTGSGRQRSAGLPLLNSVCRRWRGAADDAAAAFALRRGPQFRSLSL